MISHRSFSTPPKRYKIGKKCQKTKQTQFCPPPLLVTTLVVALILYLKSQVWDQAFQVSRFRSRQVLYAG